MSLAKGSQHYPTDQRSWDQWARDVPVTPDDNSVTTIIVQDKAITDVKLRDSQPASVIGRLSGTSGTPGDIVASADNTFLARRSGQLGFGALADTDIPATIARDSEVTTAITTAISALQAQADPFPIYQTQTEGDARYVQLANVLNGSATYDPPSLATGAVSVTSFTLTGAVVGDFCIASFSVNLQGVMMHAWISATDTFSVLFFNPTGIAVDLISGTLRGRVWKQ
jgi:hypothetical protein